MVSSMRVAGELACCEKASRVENERERAETSKTSLIMLGRKGFPTSKRSSMTLSEHATSGSSLLSIVW